MNSPDDLRPANKPAGDPADQIGVIHPGLNHIGPELPQVPDQASARGLGTPGFMPMVTSGMPASMIGPATRRSSIRETT